MVLTRVSRIKLPPDVKGHSILDYLSGRFTYLTRDGWEHAIHEGRVTLDGETATLDSVLAWNQILEYLPPDRPEPEVNTDVKLVFACDDYVVLNKPPNLPCHPAGGFFLHTLWALLKEGRVEGVPPMEQIHFISRIDRETSGLVLLARTPQFHTRACKMIHQEGTLKQYLAVVHGSFPDELEANGWLYHDPNCPVEKRRAFSLEKPSVKAENAYTSFYCIRRSEDLSLVEATLHTGRYHQIRATLCCLGYPLLGDKMYGLDETIYIRFANHCMTDEDRQKLRIDRQALHAWRLHFDGHLFEAPLPPDLQVIRG